LVDLIGIEPFQQRCERRVPARKRHRQLSRPRELAQELSSLPDQESLKGNREGAILALLLGCGLRRTELLSEVKVGAIGQRENRWVLVDISGKGKRVRSVAVPASVKATIDACPIAAGITEGKIFRTVRKGGKVWARISR
jgi:site-specific recombinase XerC